MAQISDYIAVEVKRRVDVIIYTVQSINGDYAGLRSDGGQGHSVTMFLLPEGTTVGSRLRLENFAWVPAE